MNPPALILLAHGSPDPDWRAPLERVLAAASGLAPQRPIRLAYMDFIQPSLSEAAADLIAGGATDILVVAAFLSAGGRHLKRDVPQLVAALANDVTPVRVRLAPGALGDDDAVVQVLAEAALRRSAQAVE